MASTTSTANTTATAVVVGVAMMAITPTDDDASTGAVTTSHASMITGLANMTSNMAILRGTVIGLSTLVPDVVTDVAGPVQVTLETSPRDILASANSACRPLVVWPGSPELSLRNMYYTVQCWQTAYRDSKVKQTTSDTQGVARGCCFFTQGKDEIQAVYSNGGNKGNDWCNDLAEIDPTQSYAFSLP